VPHQPALLIDRFERTREAIFCRLLPHYCLALPRLTPYMEKPKEVEGRR